MTTAIFLRLIERGRILGLMAGLLSLAVFYFTVPAFGATNGPPKTVLILDSFGRDIAPSIPWQRLFGPRWRGSWRSR